MLLSGLGRITRGSVTQWWQMAKDGKEPLVRQVNTRKAHTHSLTLPSVCSFLPAAISVFGDVVCVSVCLCCVGLPLKPALRCFRCHLWICCALHLVYLGVGFFVSVFC